MSQAGTSIEKEVSHHHHDPQQGRHKRSFPEFSNLLIFRYTLFMALELAFTALAWYCHRRPRQLPYLDFDSTTIKSGFITIFAIWHTIAVASAVTICGESFSQEWAARPEKTDEVSVVTSGIANRVFYSFRARATKTFRTAFLVFLGLTILRTMGSSTITVTSGVQFATDLPIGLLSTSALTSNSTDPNARNFQLRLNQASMIVRLEKLMRAPWGYVPEPNWLIPLPTAELNLTTSVEYKTDLVGFHYACQWQMPNVSQSGFVFGGQTWGLGGAIWTNATSTIANVSRAINGSSILELLPSSRNDTGISVYAFLGGNSTYAVNSTDTNEAWIDLSGLPSVFSPDGFVTYDHDNPKVDWVRAPLATLLVCDPRLQFTSGNVLLNPTNNLTAPDITVRSTGDVESPGNINSAAARTLFTVILNQAVGSQYTASLLANTGHANFNPAAARMFLALPAGLIDWGNAGPISPLDVKAINGRVDDFTLSALKAFTSGYKSDTDDEPSGGVDAAVVQAQYTSSRLALATSVQFAILHSVLFVVLAIMLSILAFLNRTQGRVPFDLAHVKQE